MADLVPATAPLENLVLDSVRSLHSRRSYARALADFFAWHRATQPGPFGRAAVQAYRAHLDGLGLAPATVNLRLSALRKLAAEAAENGYLDRSVAQAVISLKGVRQAGNRAGNWLSREQAQALLTAPPATTVIGKRDRAILAVLLGCGLRRTELTALRVEDLAQRENRWVFLDLLGKGSRVRTVPVPSWVKAAIDTWIAAAGLTSGRLFPLSERMIWHITAKYAAAIGVSGLAPHDLRRTCAKLCRTAGGDLEQIQFLLGHASIQTTERYLGTRQDLANAVNDRMGLGELG